MNLIPTAFLTATFLTVSKVSYFLLFVGFLDVMMMMVMNDWNQVNLNLLNTFIQLNIMLFECMNMRLYKHHVSYLIKGILIVVLWKLSPVIPHFALLYLSISQ